MSQVINSKIVVPYLFMLDSHRNENINFGTILFIAIEWKVDLLCKSHEMLEHNCS